MDSFRNKTIDFENDNGIVELFEKFQRDVQENIREKQKSNTLNNQSFIKNIKNETDQIFVRIKEFEDYLKSEINKVPYQVDYSLEDMPINRYEVSCVKSPLDKEQINYQLHKKGSVLLFGAISKEVRNWIHSLGLEPILVPSEVKEADMPSYFTSSFLGLIGISDKVWQEEECLNFVKQMYIAGKHTAMIWYKRKIRPFFVIVTKLGGAFGIDGLEPNFVTGCLGGLCKTAAREWGNNVFVHYIDMQSEVSSQEIIQHVTDELRYGKEVQIGYTQDNERITLGLTERYESQIDYHHLPDENDVIFAVGGAEGVTASCILEMAKRFHCKFLLCGINEMEVDYVEHYEGMNREEIRQSILYEYKARGEYIVPAIADQQACQILVQRQIHQTMNQMKEIGCQAVYYQCDINNRTRVHDIAQLGEEKLGKITGIVHGAGIISNSLLNSKTIEMFNHVFGVKYNGINNMMSAVDSEQLRFLVLFSSIAAFFGNFGQSDYSCANEYLNNYARYFKKTHPNCKVMSINWGPWNGGMVDRVLKTAMLRRGKTLIDMEVGKMFFVDILAKICDQTTCQILINDVDDLGGLF